jgi:hypothetical protein
MLPDYADIRTAIDREPDWFTIDGVPRYRAFHPDMLGVYDRMAVLVAVECASCSHRMLVGDGSPEFAFNIKTGQMDTYAVEDFAAGLAMSDPPRHSCPGGGETMGCDEMSVVEAWDQADHEWRRRSDLEGPRADYKGED